MSEYIRHAHAELPRRPGPVTRAFRVWFAVALWKRILAALLVGAGVGMAWGEGATSIAWVGEVFIRLIRMLVIPLVFFTIASGVAALADPKRLGSIGVKTLSMYVLTTTLAVTTGLIVATLLSPGAGASFADAVPRAVAPPSEAARMFIEIIPDNPVGAMANGRTLSVIFFAVLTGAIAGLGALRELLAQAGPNVGTEVSGRTGLTSHIADVLRRSGRPSRMQVKGA